MVTSFIVRLMVVSITLPGPFEASVELCRLPSPVREHLITFSHFFMVLVAIVAVVTQFIISI